jgi:hypothetical protein
MGLGSSQNDLNGLILNWWVLVHSSPTIVDVLFPYCRLNIILTQFPYNPDT